MKRIQKTPGKSRTIPGIRRPSVRGPLPHSPFATLCHLLKVMKDQAVRLLSVLTPSHLSGITQVMWGALRLTRMKKKQRTTVLCQVRTCCCLLLWRQLQDVPVCGKGGGLRSCFYTVGWFSGTINRCEQSHLLSVFMEGILLSSPSLIVRNKVLRTLSF